MGASITFHFLVLMHMDFVCTHIFTSLSSTLKSGQLDDHGHVLLSADPQTALQNNCCTTRVMYVDWDSSIPSSRLAVICPFLKPEAVNLEAIELDWISVEVHLP